MKKFAFILCVTFVSLLAQAQIQDNVTTTKEKYLKVLRASNWEIKSWFDNDTVTLIPMEKLKEVTNVSEDSVVKLPPVHLQYGTHLSFDDRGRFMFEYSVFCPVGMTMYDIQSFKIKGKKVFVEYCSYEFGPEQKKEYKKAVFKIV